eukprot:5256746-Amphidinium_carterae.2
MIKAWMVEIAATVHFIYLLLCPYTQVSKCVDNSSEPGGCSSPFLAAAQQQRIDTQGAAAGDIPQCPRGYT